MKHIFLTSILALATVIGFAQNRKHTDKERKLPTAHESMHAAQFLHGQGGASIYNEVEAYAFANYISYNSWSDDKSSYEINPMSIYSENILKNAYSSIYSNLSDYNKINSDLFFPSIITSVLFFKSLSNENNNGLYDNNILFPNRNKLYLESMLRLYITK